MGNQDEQYPQVSELDMALRQELAASEPLEGELITGPREYTVLKTITHRGEHKAPGDTVKLHDHQAERLIRSGHIQQ